MEQYYVTVSPCVLASRIVVIVFDTVFNPRSVTSQYSSMWTPFCIKKILVTFLSLKKHFKYLSPTLYVCGEY